MKRLLSLLLLAPLGALAQSPYAGSAACKTCHEAIYNRWSKTRMTNAVRDPRTHPDAILPNLSKPNPLVNLRRAISHSCMAANGSSATSRRSDDYYPLDAQWDITHQVWRAYHAAPGTDWWTAFYPSDNMQRPTGSLCDGCHLVNYNIQTKTVTEWNVGCEKCHGPTATCRRSSRPSPM